MREQLVGPLGLSGVDYVLPGAEGGSWYPGRFFDPFEVNEPWLSRALAAVDAAIAQTGRPPERIVLAGFSQGACVLAEHVARRPAPYAGVALLTGALMGPPGAVTAVSPLAGLRVFASAGRHDSWIPLEHIEATARAFEAAGARVTLRVTDNREHEITPEAVAGTRELLHSASVSGPARSRSAS
jgi:phospholipase/carboxylesterase